MPVKVLCDAGDGIEIRTLHRGLADRIFRIVQAERDHLGRFLPWVQQTQSISDTVRFLAQARDAFLHGQAVHGAIWVDGELAGMMALTLHNKVDQCAHIGYWLSSRVQGRGVIAKALPEFVRYAFTEWRLHRIEILCATDNVRSCRVAERAGFVHEGVLREARKVNGAYLDMHVYSLLEQEWRARMAATGQREAQPSI